jgi:hypothetical protein
MKRLTLIALAIASCAAAAVSAQEPANTNPATRLDNITAVSCTFPASTRVGWGKDGAPPTANVRGGSPLVVKVQEIDPDLGMAVITSPTNADASVQVYGWNMHILEPSRSGRMLMLTIFGRESSGGKLKATYTRTDYLPVDLPGFITEPDASQYYGECEVTRSN